MAKTGGSFNMKNSNNYICVIPQIKSVKSIENIEEIAAVESAGWIREAGRRERGAVLYVRLLL